MAIDTSILKHGTLPRRWTYVVGAALVAALPLAPALLSRDEKLEFLGLKAFGCIVGIILAWLLTGKEVRFSSRRVAYQAVGVVSFLYVSGMIVYVSLDADDFFYVLCGLAFIVSGCVGFVLYVATPAFKIVADQTSDDAPNAGSS